jgi:hypothetical protein
MTYRGSASNRPTRSEARADNCLAHWCERTGSGRDSIVKPQDCSIEVGQLANWPVGLTRILLAAAGTGTLVLLTAVVFCVREARIGELGC